MISVERQGVARATAILLAVLVAVAAVVAPLPTAIGVIGIVALIWIVGQGRGVIRVFLVGLAAILIGYAFFNRAFAYVGYPPIFVGELVLLIGVLAFCYSARRWRMTPVIAVMLLFMGWCLLQTVPYLPRYGTDALRDAVAWIYAGFAIILGTVLLPEHFPSIVRLYRRVIPYYLVWVPIAGLTAVIFDAVIPRIPGTDVPWLAFKGGDAGVLLAGIAAFILVGLYARADPHPRLPEPLPWILWLASAGVVSIVNRGGMVAASMIVFSFVFIRDAGRWLGLLFIVALIVVVGMAVNPRFSVGGKDREFSFSQLTDNVTSIFTSSGDNLEGTKDFRLRWWGTIVDYTVNGPYFWTGKGYGIALARADGFDTTSATDLRSPHNGHIEVLARAGVPGFILWVLLQVTFAISMLSAAAKARADGRRFWLQVIGWTFVMWLAGLANATFDPYLQGPQGGIWFWSSMGLGLAAMRAVHDGAPDPWAEDAPASPAPAAPPPTAPETPRGATAGA